MARYINHDFLFSYDGIYMSAIFKLQAGDFIMSKIDNRGRMNGGTAAVSVPAGSGSSTPGESLAASVFAAIAGTAIVGGTLTLPSSSSGAYASGDLMANATASGSVIFPSFHVGGEASMTGAITGLRLSKSTNGLTGAAFRVHLFKKKPASTTVGDNGVFAGALPIIAAIHIGYVDITMDVSGSDGAKGEASPARNVLLFDTDTTDELWWALEARGAYTGGGSEVFTLAVELMKDFA